jgi:pimeloyl-ACP methyl ester carboxylesterase
MAPLPTRFGICLFFLGTCLASSACTTLTRVIGFKKQVAKAEAKARVSGRIETEGAAEGTLVVVLGHIVRGDGLEEGELKGVDSYVRLNDGSYLFIVAPGRYRVGAYEDRNQNGLLDPDERAFRLRDGPILEVGAGDRATQDIYLAIGQTSGLTEPVDVLAIVERDVREQSRFSLWAFSVQGKLCEDLSDPRFGPDAGPRGLWQPFDFLNDELAGIYFLEPYDSGRTPVLFVHGIAGYPWQFSALIESLDRKRFQPWFYFYPSGFSLDGISGHLAELLTRLQVKYGYDEMAVVAHSMGGLVSRGAILKSVSETERDHVRLFISISTPWGGDVAARRTGNAPIALPASFTDMDPSSTYLRWLFYEDDAGKVPKRLPKRAEYHMIFGFRGSGGACNDGTVRCASQAREIVQEEARTIRAWDQTHVGILESPAAVDRVNRLLAQAF